MRKAIAVIFILLWSTVIPLSAFSESLSPQQYLQQIKQRYGQIRDYQCRMEEFAIGNGKREERIMNFYFKKPRLIRIDILKGNRPFDGGSVGVYTGGDKVSGHRGGVIKGLTFNIPKDSPLATSVRGETIDQSDMYSVIERFDRNLRSGEITVEEKYSRLEFEYIPDDPTLNDGVTRDIMWIDRQSMLIIRNERFEGEMLVQRVMWTDYIINAGLPDELFDPRFEIEELEGRGIELLSQELED
jgi:outer membrane lipoprotein-sorting protein